MNHCCAQCFRNSYLKRLIRARGVMGDCDYCEAANVLVIRTSELREVFQPVVALYDPVERDVHYPAEGILEVWDFEPLTRLLDADWKIFADRLEDDARHRLMDDVWIRRGRESDGIYDVPPSEPWARHDDRIWGVTPEQTWRWFADAVKVGDWDAINLDDTGEIVHVDRWVALSLRHRRATRVIMPNTVLYRGRPNHPPLVSPNGPVLPWPAFEMHAPPLPLAQRGRVNRAGQRVFYAACELDTALWEAGRQVGAYVSVRQVAAVRRLRLADLTKFHGVSQPFGVRDLVSVVRHARLLHQLNLELARHVNETDADIDYLPTQVLGDAIRDAGYDGIYYGSARRLGGTNIVIFNPNDMRVLPDSSSSCVLPVPEQLESAMNRFLQNDTLEI